MDAVILAFLAENIVNEEYRKERIYRKQLRDSSDPLSLPDTVFISNFRLNKEAFLYVLNAIACHLRDSSIPPVLKLAASLRFLAEGGYQRGIAKNFDIAMARTTFSKTLSEILEIIESQLCARWIKLEMSEDEIRHSKLFFYEKYGFPGVIGCIDGSHINIIKPYENDYLYMNRKGHFSINTMIICDFNMRIRAVDSTHPGSSHDSLIWNMSGARQYFRRRHQSGEKDTWLLGDSGYPLEPFLITPYRDPDARSMQSRFNQRHSKARNIVERTIGVLKSRFRCLAQARQLHYSPLKASKIINVCAALHNICKHYHVELREDELQYPNINENTDDDINGFQSEDSGISVRDSIASNLC